MGKKFLAAFMLLFFILGIMGCAGLEPIEVREKTYGKAVPVISESFASKQIRPGATWKIYLIASDPDGDMKNIVCIVEQPGVGTYPVSITRIGENNQKELSGYIYLNTFSRDDLNFVTITLTVQVQDKAGHYSQPAVFPLSLQSRSRQEPPPPGIFKENDLGPIMIQLRTIRDEEEKGIFQRDK